MTLKHCNGCDEDKPLTEFYFHKTGRSTGKPFSKCKGCTKNASLVWAKANPEKSKAFSRAWKNSNSEKVKAINRAWYNNDPEKARKLGRENSYRHGSKPALENKSCSLYLGCVIAETILAHEFPGFVRMPPGNPDYDYDCPKGFTIDVKSSCRYHPKAGSERWSFQIRKNKVANYFLCIAFDERKTLNPEHLWLIPGDVVNEKMAIRITDSPKSLSKWSQFERPLDNVLNCCNKMR